MLQYSTFFKPIFWIIMGLIYALIIAGAPIWMQDMGVQMSWWKWILAAVWYVLLSFSFAGSFTLLGEKEPAAWYRFLFFNLIITIIVGVIFALLIF
jgi:hypothetical protein